MKRGNEEVRRALAPAKGPLAFVLAGSVVAAALTIAQAFALAAFIVAAVGRHQLAGPAVGVAAVFVARALAGLVTDVGAASAAARVSTALRRRLLAAYLQPGGPERTTGAAAALATRGIQSAEPYLTRYLPAFLLSLVVPPLVVVTIASQDLLTAAIVIGTLPLLPVFGALVGLATRDKADQQWQAMSSLSGHFLDVMKGLPTLVAFRRAERQIASIRQISERYRRRSFETLKIAFASSAVLDLVATLSVALVAVVVGVRLAEGGLALQTGLVVLLLAPEAYAPIRRAGAEFHASAEGMATFAAVAAADPDESHAALGVRSGPLVISRISATYPGRAVLAFQPISTTVPEVGLTVVVGRSGSGKSSFLAALADLLPVDGSRMIDGWPASGDPWRSRIAWLPQRPIFLASSIAANVRLGAPQATDSEVWSALSQVGLGAWVSASPRSLDQAVGEDGHQLSAGQRARLALARVVVASRPWTLLDEPTAHLDPQNRHAINDLLVTLAASRAVVVATHDPDLIARADHVIQVQPAAQSARRHERPAPALSAPRPETPSLDAPSRRRTPTLAVSNALAALSASFGVALTATAGWLIVRASERPAILTMLVAIVGVRMFGLGRPVLRYAARLLGHDAALGRLTERRARVFADVVPLTPGALGRDRGSALTAIVDDVESVVDRELRVREPLWTAALVGIGVIGLVAAVRPVLAVLVGVAIAVAGVGAFATSYLGCRRTESELIRRRSDLSAFVVESLQLATDLVMWQGTSSRIEGGVALASDLAAVTRNAARAVALARAVVIGACAAGVVAVGIAGSRLGISGPVLALTTLIPLAMIDVLLPLADAGGLARRVQAAEARLRDVATRPPLVSDPAAPAPSAGDSSVVAAGLAVGWGDRPAFSDLDFHLPPGGRVAVVGPSGSGKSTLAAALMRFVDPIDGSLGLGGQPLAAQPLHEVRRRIGLVEDDPHVFATTVAANLRLARADATDAELLAALKDAHLDAWLDALPQGLESPLGEGSSGLSGGERARLGLARALLAAPAVLVLDEPVAQLDEETAAAVAEAVLGAGRRQSVVWITHREVGLQRVDRVLNLGAHEPQAATSAQR